jgi:hypothetical protein
MSRYFHVTSVRNRESISAHGLDWTRMGMARGIAGSASPEVDGIFLCRGDSDVEFFVRLNNTGTAVDVWEVDGVDPDALIDNGSGFAYLPHRIDAGPLTLLRRDIAAVQRP